MPIVTLSLANAPPVAAMRARPSVRMKRWARRMERSEAGEGKPEHNTAGRESVKHNNPPSPVKGRGDLKATFRKVRDAQLALEPPAGRARRSAMNRSNSSRSLA